MNNDPQPQKANTTGKLPVGRLSAELVSADMLSDPKLIKGIENCFLKTVATYLSGGIFGADNVINTPLEDTEREETAQQLGEYYVKHCGDVQIRNETYKKETGFTPQLDGEVIRNIARYTVHTYGNTYLNKTCLLYTSPSPRDKRQSRMPSSA